MTDLAERASAVAEDVMAPLIKAYGERVQHCFLPAMHILRKGTVHFPTDESQPTIVESLPGALSVAITQGGKHCPCPQFNADNFCKHILALRLAKAAESVPEQYQSGTNSAPEQNHKGTEPTPEFPCVTCGTIYPTRQDERDCFKSHKKEQHMAEQPTQQETLPARPQFGGLPVPVTTAIAGRMPHLYSMLPPDVKGEAFRASVIVALQDIKPDDLAKCKPESVVAAITKAAMKGWLPSSPDCHFVAFGGKLDCWDGYPGLQKDLARSPFVRDSFAEVVHARDHFHLDMLKDDLSHRPDLDDRGAIRGYYAVVVFRDGTRRVKYMNTKEIDEAKRSIPSAAQKGSAWQTHPDSMAKVLVLRRLARSVVQIAGDDHEYDEGSEDAVAQLPMTAERQQAAIADMYGDDR